MWKIAVAAVAGAAGLAAAAAAQVPMQDVREPARSADGVHWPDQIVCHFPDDRRKGRPPGRDYGERTVIVRLALAPGGDGRWFYTGWGGLELTFFADGEATDRKEAHPGMADCQARSIRELEAKGLLR